MRKRIEQLRQVWQATAKVDPQLRVRVILWSVVGLIPFILLAIFASWIWIFPGILAGPTVGMSVFGRRAQKAQYRAMEGHPGAAAAILNSMKGQWFVQPGVAFNKKQDFVHRVIGRCGIVLVGEGNRHGVKQLLAQERKRLKRISGDVSIHVVLVGNGDDEVSIGKLQMTMNKLPRELKKTEVPKVERRISSMDRDLPMPKGYIPNPGKKMR
jgi:hypothetical protein